MASNDELVILFLILFSVLSSKFRSSKGLAYVLDRRTIVKTCPFIVLLAF